MASTEEKSGGTDTQEKQTNKPKTMDELRRPGIENLPPTGGEFHIISPGPHVPEGQDSHE
jgi:hypothetical protein